MPDRSQPSLRELLNDWDPIGVADIAPADEYDCLIGPLLSRLRAGAGQSEIGDFLRDQLDSHFGLDSNNCDVDGVAQRIGGWWSTAEESSW